MGPTHPQSLPRTAGRKIGPEVMKAGELALPLTCCSMPELHLCSTVEVALDVGISGEPAQGCDYGKLPLSAVWQHRWKGDAPSTPTPHHLDKRESWPQGHESGRTVPAPPWLQHSRE